MEEDAGEDRVVKANPEDVGGEGAPIGDCLVEGGFVWPFPSKEEPTAETAPTFPPLRGRDLFYSLLLGLLCHVAVLIVVPVVFLCVGWESPDFQYLGMAAQLLSFCAIMRFIVDKRSDGRDGIGLKWPEEPGLWLQATMIYFLFRAFVYFLYFRRMGPTADRHYATMAEHVLEMILMIVIGPLIEELVFRGVGLAGYSRSYPVWFAVVITSIGFSVLHGSWSPYHFFMGICFCLIRLRTRSLYCAVVFHGLHNLLVTL